jgi:peptidoglycan/xylan/chitin deacetylase (PgdA/CDA1 family)
MIGNRYAQFRIGQSTRGSLLLGPLLAGSLALTACFAPTSAAAAECPGHPDALGTSRVLVVDPREHPRIGTMQYPETLPLEDHEVVLTFDDGPLPRYSNQVLQILADQCVKATFFTIGEQARANPEGVRKLAAAGHTIATHSQTHPLTFAKLPLEKAQPEIDDGIASTAAALADPSALSPFFRFPGLLKSEVAENYLADDWRSISPARVYDLAIKRLEEKHKGILLLHDIHARTVAALPNILRELKARGYRIVQVVPATAERPATPTDPVQWQLHPPSERVPIARWPRVPTFAYADNNMMPAPALAGFEMPSGDLLLSGQPFDRVKRGAPGAPAWRDTDWTRLSAELPPPAAFTLAAPAASLFELPPDARAAFASLPLSPARAEPDQENRQKQTAAEQDRPSRGGTGRARNSRSHVADAAHRSGRGAATRGASSGKSARRSVRVASLKKRKI